MSFPGWAWAAAVDHRPEAGLGLDMGEPGFGPGVDRTDGLAVSALQVQYQQIAGLGRLLVHHREEEVSLGDRVVGGVTEVVGAAHNALLRQLPPVPGEGLVAEIQPLGGLDDKAVAPDGLGGEPRADQLGVVDGFGGPRVG
jgi:hypothetical protein